jgi:hypothetical protein
MWQPWHVALPVHKQGVHTSSAQTLAIAVNASAADSATSDVFRLFMVTFSKFDWSSKCKPFSERNP